MATGPRYYTPKAYAWDQIGNPVPLALLNFYLTASDTRTPTYANASLTVANTNPVVANSAGLFPDIFLDPTIIYKVVYTGPDDGITDPVEFWTADPVQEAWAVSNAVDYWDLPFEFLGDPPAGGEIMGIYVTDRPQQIFADFNGVPDGFARAVGACIAAPSDGNVEIAVLKNGVTNVGTVTVVVDTGAFLFETASGLAIDLDTNEYLVFQMQEIADSTFANAAWTITGINV